MSTPCPQEGDSSSSRGKESNLWSGLRVAGLCVGVGEYPHIGNLSNAVQDAEAVCTRLKTAPNCHAAQITNTTATSTAVELLRSVRKYVQEPGLIKDPPALFIIHYAGHGIQTKGKTVYLVPGNARADHPGDLGHECLSLDTLLLTLRQELDEPVRQKHGESKAIAFLVVLDACRVNGPDRSFNGALACEPAPESAPLKYTIVFSCSRTKTASDGPSGGHSPFVRELLDERCGIFAEGISLYTAIANVSNALPEAQAPKSIGLEALPQDFCIRPGPTRSGMPRRRWEADSELQALLREFKLEEQAGHLAKRGGVTSVAELKEFELEDVDKLGLPFVLHARRFLNLLRHVHKQERYQKCKRKWEADEGSAGF